MVAMGLLIAKVALADQAELATMSQLELEKRLYAVPRPLGVIASTGTTKNNHDTAAAFNNTGDALKGKILLLRSSVAARFLPGTANTAATVATAGQATTGVPIAAGERVVVVMTDTYGWVAYLPDSGSGNLEVWELK